MKNIKEFLSSGKAKVLTLAGVGLVATNAMADVTIAADGTVSGSLDKGTFMGIAGIVATLLGVIFGVRRGLSLLR